MDKMETPEEFVITLNHLFETPWSKEGWSEIFAIAIKLVAFRDLAIRADERRKAAERAVKYIHNFDDKELSQFWDMEIRAEITAEPEEATK